MDFWCSFICLKLLSNSLVLREGRRVCVLFSCTPELMLKCHSWLGFLSCLPLGSISDCNMMEQLLILTLYLLNLLWIIILNFSKLFVSMHYICSGSFEWHVGIKFMNCVFVSVKQFVDSFIPPLYYKIYTDIKKTYVACVHLKTASCQFPKQLFIKILQLSIKIFQLFINNLFGGWISFELFNPLAHPTLNLIF